MSRIIAGEAKGRTLVVPKSGTRPTSDRVRESLFSMLDSRIDDWSEQRVLDLFAGSGALGLEAVSRGAVAAVLVDNAAGAVAAINKNVKALDLGQDSVTVVRSTAASWAANSAGAERHSLVFLDPPYELPNVEVEQLLAQLASQRHLTEDALIVVERSARGDQFAYPEGEFEQIAERKYGDTMITIGLFIG